MRIGGGVIEGGAPVVLGRGCRSGGFRPFTTLRWSVVGVDQGPGSAAATGSHIYARPGRYLVTLTVTDDDGGTTTQTKAVGVGCTGVACTAH